MTTNGPCVINVKVSVGMITYNHEQFISQAIESVMMQETDFNFELVVGEDCSTDNTRQILMGMKEKYPERIRLLLHERNLGKNENFKRTLNACKGQYLALLEGDDFWTSKQKLQVQVEALEKTPDWAVCTHPMKVIYEGQTKPSYQYPTFIPKPVSTLDDLSRGPFVGTSSAVYRNIPDVQYPDWFFQVTIGDYAISLFYAQFGKIGFINKEMSVYRLHPGGTWSQRSGLKQRTSLALDLRVMAKSFRWSNRINLEGQAVQALRKIVKLHLLNGDVPKARKVMLSILTMAYCIPKLQWHRYVKLSLMVYTPRIARVLYRAM